MNVLDFVNLPIEPQPDPVAAAKEACRKDAARQADDLALMRQALEALEAEEKDDRNLGYCRRCGGWAVNPVGDVRHPEWCTRQAAIDALRKRLGE
jgi:hypothetical protein